MEKDKNGKWKMEKMEKNCTRENNKDLRVRV